MKRRIKWNNVIMFIIMLILFIILIISSIKIINWFIDNKKTNDNIKKINEIVDIKDTEDNENTEIIEQKDIDKSNTYYDFIKMNLIDVDFKELKKKN